jgi:hypothetical protein
MAPHDFSAAVCGYEIPRAAPGDPWADSSAEAEAEAETEAETAAKAEVAAAAGITVEMRPALPTNCRRVALKTPMDGLESLEDTA